jgi:hydrogenase maturation protease
MKVNGTKNRRARPRVLIAGLGNVLLMDDGVGVHAVKELQRDVSPGVLAVEVGTAVLDALHLFEWADRVLAIDAMQAGGRTGTAYAFGIRDIREPSLQASLHELSLLGALRLLPTPRRPVVLVLGIEPEKIGYGLDLSPALQAALPKLVQEAKRIVTYWKGGSGSDRTECHRAVSGSHQRLYVRE